MLRRFQPELLDGEIRVRRLTGPDHGPSRQQRRAA
jgi:hypothetical protein